MIGGLIAAAAATLVPVMLLAMREIIRRRRSAMLDELTEALFKTSRHIPTLEFARSKYGTGAHPTSGRSLVPTWILLISAIPYLCLSILGFLLLFIPYSTLLPTDPPSHTSLTQSLFWLDPTDDPSANAPLLSTTAIASFGFLGSYVFTLRLLLRAVMNFELSPLTWLRASTHIVSGMIVAVLIYRVFVGTPFISHFMQLTAEENTQTVPLRLWLGFAFVAGYVPDFGLFTLVRRLRISHLKTVDGKILQGVSIIPIEILDGIDYDIRYRLEETNIADVQNLATYNPILLYVETPFGLYEAFDWVLQAQLCTVVGTKTFLELKKIHIRTIFDLERAVLADDAPDSMVRLVGSVLYADAPANLRELISTEGEMPALNVASIKHAVMVMGDDLHIHRLRQLWIEIYEQLTKCSGRDWLYRSARASRKARPSQQSAPGLAA